MTKYIGESRTLKPFIVDKHDDGSYSFTTEDKTIMFSCDEQEVGVINKLLHITPERKPYSRSVFRNKLVSACPQMGNGKKVTVFKVMSPSKRVPCKALIHTNLYIPANSYKRLVMCLSKAMRDNMLSYVYINNKELDCSFLNEEIFIQTIGSDAVIDKMVNNDMNISVKIGFNSLKFFLYMTLNNISNPRNYDVDYSVYIGSNVIINQINDELKGTY